eukprot:scaffold14371_cov115-Isochrysis_galbana.AAC.3
MVARAGGLLATRRLMVDGHSGVWRAVYNVRKCEKKSPTPHRWLKINTTKEELLTNEFFTTFQARTRTNYGDISRAVSVPSHRGTPLRSRTECRSRTTCSRTLRGCLKRLRAPCGLLDPLDIGRT